MISRKGCWGQPEWKLEGRKWCNDYEQAHRHHHRLPASLDVTRAPGLDGWWWVRWYINKITEEEEEQNVFSSLSHETLAELLGGKRKAGQESSKHTSPRGLGEDDWLLVGCLLGETKTFDELFFVCLSSEKEHNKSQAEWPRWRPRRRQRSWNERESSPRIESLCLLREASPSSTMRRKGCGRSTGNERQQRRKTDDTFNIQIHSETRAKKLS